MTRRSLQRRWWVLKKRGRVLKKAFLVRQKGGGPLLKKGVWLLKKVGRVLKEPVKVLKEFDTPRRSTLHLPE